jgi:hypothetical protein
MVALLSACGGGGGGAAGQAAAPVPAIAASPATSAVPQPAEAPSSAPASAFLADAIVPPVSTTPLCPAEMCVRTPNDAMAAGSGSPDVPDAQGTLVAAAQVTTTTGEAPYPDLRMLPTRIMPFEPIAFGDVSLVAVTSVR